MKHIRSSILAYFLIGLFVSYYTGDIAFTHVHHYMNYTIIHSHPYLPGPHGQPLHTHSQNAFSTIHLLNQITIEPTPVNVVSISWQLLTTFIYSHTYSCVLQTAHTSSLRAPPVTYNI